MPTVPDSKFNKVSVLGKIFFILSLILINFSLLSQITRYSNDFLNIGATAQGIALGNGLIASSQGASAIYYNPANITNLSNSFDFAITHSQYFANTANYDALLAAYKYNNNISLGLGIIRLGIDNIPNTLNIYNNGSFNLAQITYFSVEDYAVLFVWAQKRSKFSYAIRPKFIYRHLGSFAQGFGFGIDASISFKWKKINFGANFNDILGTYTAWFYSLDQHTINVFDSTGNEIPHNSIEIAIPSTQLGINRNFNINNKIQLKNEFNLFIQWTYQTAAIISSSLASISPAFSTEIIYKKVIFFRVGLSNFQKINFFVSNNSTEFRERINFVPSIGLGFRYHKIIIDYSFQNVFNKTIPLQSHFITARFPLDLKNKKEN